MYQLNVPMCLWWIYFGMNKYMDSTQNKSLQDWNYSVLLIPDADCREKKYKAHRQFGDRRGGVTSARTYFYADESKCDNQMETFINCISASGESVLWVSSYKILY